MKPSPLGFGLILVALGLAPPAAAAATVELSPSADTGLRGRTGGQDNNLGAATTLIAGGVATSEKARSLLEFDIAGSVPSGATVTSVQLQLTVTKAAFGAGSNFALHRALVDWGEGAGTGDRGRLAITGEASFNHRFAPSTSWGAPGGQSGVDYSAAASVSTFVNQAGTYTWPASAQLVADVQGWLDGTVSNHGWFLIGDAETTAGTARRFGSREDAGNAPTLVIEYTLPFKITQFDVNGAMASITWSGGAPPYQIQNASTAGGPYSNVNPPIQTTSTTLAVSGDQTYFRVVSEQTARYRATFQAVWNSTTHPQDYPGGAHWSGLVGGTHNASVSFWEPGQLASPGIKSMAEFGGQSTLLGEVAAAIQAGAAEHQLSGGGIGGGSGSSSLTFDVSRDFPLVTLTSMIAPSPDWFIGVRGESLLANGDWVESKVIQLHLYDAGTDAGASYASSNQPENPFVPVSQIQGFPAEVDGMLTAFGTMTFTRLHE